MREDASDHPSAAAQWRMRAKEIALEMDDDRFLNLPELSKLPEALLPGESVLAITSGAMHAATSLIALTDRRVVMLDMGTMMIGEGAVPVLKKESIELGEVSDRLVGHMGFTHGAIVVDDGMSIWRFWRIPNDTVNRFLEKLGQATASLSCSGIVDDGPAQSEERSRIEFLDRLFGQGLITDDEFVELQKSRRNP